MNKRYTYITFCLLLGCSSQQQALNHGKSPTPTKTKRTTVEWVLVNDGNSFIYAIEESKRTVALVGNSFCAPCSQAKHWWESQFVPPGWLFVYWNTLESQDPFSQNLKQIFTIRTNQANFRIPYLTIIEKVTNQARSHEMITAEFQSLDNCTEGAFKFLNMYPQGKIQF
ncbi:hypothetical protein KKG46_00410 [Patescibacteria group bacterium]|nr:hypothetical protein [Patescibacteria group bacterium]